MPIPAPKTDENQKDFLKRFMADPIMVKEYPDEKQRYAVGLEQWKEKISAAQAIADGWWDITASETPFVGSIGGKPARHEFSKEDIKTLANGYNPDVLEAPVKIEHKDDGPAHGWIAALRTQLRNGKLYLQAQLKQVSEALQIALAAGSYRSRSAEIYIDFQGSGKPYLCGLAFLGAAEPAVKGLRSYPSLASEMLSRGESAAGLILCSGAGPPEDEIFLSVPDDFNFETEEVSEMDAKVITDAIGTGFDKILTTFKGGTQDTEAAEKLQAAEAEKADLETKLVAAEAKAKEAEDKIKAADAEAQLATFKTGVEKAKDENRIIPADAKMFLELGEKMNEENRKLILEDISAREPNKLLAELSAPSHKGNATNRTALARKAAEKVWASQENVDEKDKKLSLASWDLMDANEKMTFTEAMKLVAAAAD